MKIISNLILIFALYFTLKYILLEKFKFNGHENIIKIAKFILGGVILILVLLKVLKLLKVFTFKSNTKNS